MSDPIDICPELKIYFTWLCCLHPIEASPMAALIAIRTGGMLDFITVQAFDEIWTLSGDPVGSPRYKQFIYVYYLHKQELEIGGEPVDIYRMLDPFWFKMLLWTGCEQYGCGGGCFEREYSLG